MACHASFRNPPSPQLTSEKHTLLWIHIYVSQRPWLPRDRTSVLETT